MGDISIAELKSQAVLKIINNQLYKSISERKDQLLLESSVHADDIMMNRSISCTDIVYVVMRHYDVLVAP